MADLIRPFIPTPLTTPQIVGTTLVDCMISYDQAAFAS